MKSLATSCRCAARCTAARRPRGAATWTSYVLSSKRNKVKKTRILNRRTKHKNNREIKQKDKEDKEDPVYLTAVIWQPVKVKSWSTRVLLYREVERSLQWLRCKKYTCLSLCCGKSNPSLAAWQHHTIGAVWSETWGVKLTRSSSASSQREERQKCRADS